METISATLNVHAEAIEARAPLILLDGYVLATELEAAIADLNLAMANTISTDTLRAASAIIDYMMLNDEYCTWKSKTVQTSIPNFLRTTIKDGNGNSVSVVTGWAEAPSTKQSTLYYLSHN